MAQLGFNFRADMARPDRLLVLWLVYSCAYYDFNVSLVSDADFDLLSRGLHEVRDGVTIPHRRLVDWEALAKTGSAYYLSGRFPMIVRSVTMRLILEQETRVELKGSWKMSGAKAWRRSGRVSRGEPGRDRSRRPSFG